MDSGSSVNSAMSMKELQAKSGQIQRKQEEINNEMNSLNMR